MVRGRPLLSVPFVLARDRSVHRSAPLCLPFQRSMLACLRTPRRPASRARLGPPQGSTDLIETCNGDFTDRFVASPLRCFANFLALRVDTTNEENDTCPLTRPRTQPG
jgi:hypothetical protein